MTLSGHFRPNAGMSGTPGPHSSLAGIAFTRTDGFVRCDGGSEGEIRKRWAIREVAQTPQA
jgi:hypothetical protein